MAWFVKRSLSSHVYNVTYHDCFIAFRLDLIPSVVFVGVYMPHENSKYFKSSLFAEVCAFFITYHEKGISIYVGGDFNCRPGDLNAIKNNSEWKYSKNVDEKTNTNGTTYFIDLCRTADVMPVNHLQYRKKTFEGDFTYYKLEKKSQNDFLLTDKQGRQNITEFLIIKDGWHISDHRPISTTIKVKADYSASALLVRAKELNQEIGVSNSFKMQRFKGNFNYDKIEEYLTNNDVDINISVNNLLQQHDIEGAMKCMDKHLKDAHAVASCDHSSTQSTDILKDVNTAFRAFNNCLKDDTKSQRQIDDAQIAYNNIRKRVNYKILKDDAVRWNNVIMDKDSSKLWKSIDWKGNYGKVKPLKHPTVEEFQVFFEDLYGDKDAENENFISNLQAPDIHIPVLDEPFTEKEMHKASDDMKSGGFDYNKQIISILVAKFSVTMLMLLNFMFSIRYPLHLALSMLTVIPKKGNLLLPKNFRGIQMMRAMGSLFDRIITNRIILWMNIQPEQSAFQRGKSALLQVFTLRVLIEIANKMNVTLYIAFVDLEKAFDLVSRFKLLAKLLLLGIGYNMFNALKSIYSYTACYINLFGDCSDPFETNSGIRQGAASSVLLFIIFMNDLFGYLVTNCEEEIIIKSIHALIHADDTVIISTNREKFIKKCNHMIDFFQVNSLRLNILKSFYMIINSKPDVIKTGIRLKSGILKYNSSVIYLGTVFSDSGAHLPDIKSFIDSKRSNITIKFANFCKKNLNAPLHCKLIVLDTCARSSLTYASETWGIHHSFADSIYRQGLKSALGIRQNTNNEIVYTETNRFPLQCYIQKLQYNFWLQVKKFISDNEESLLANLVKLSTDMKLPYVRHYTNLENKYTSKLDCFSCITNNFKAEWENKFRASANDEDSKLATYLRINPQLVSPISKQQELLEIERILVTRYRTGSHSLAVETGRYTRPMTERKNRLCKCNTSVQTVLHCFTTCPITTPYISGNFTNLYDVFEDKNVYKNLLTINRKLKLPLDL